MKIFWYLKQLFPLTYRSFYKQGGKQYFDVWKMWFGKVYKYDSVVVNKIVKKS